jgi:hypothetical protein
MAYSCTFEHCDHGPFGSRTSWTNHEQRHHLRSWRCPFCYDDFETQARVTRHVSAAHPSVDRTLVDELVIAASPKAERVPISQCPFCDDRHSWKSVLVQPSVFTSQAKARDDWVSRDELVSVALYHRHISHHMEQLALFAVPAVANDEEDGDTSDRSSQIALDEGVVVHKTSVHLPTLSEGHSISSQAGPDMPTLSAANSLASTVPVSPQRPIPAIDAVPSPPRAESVSDTDDDYQRQTFITRSPADQDRSRRMEQQRIRTASTEAVDGRHSVHAGREIESLGLPREGRSTSTARHMSWDSIPEASDWPQRNHHEPQRSIYPQPSVYAVPPSYSALQPAISARRSSIMPGSFPGESLTRASPPESSSESSGEPETSPALPRSESSRFERPPLKHTRRYEQGGRKDRLQQPREEIISMGGRPPGPREREMQSEREQRPARSHTGAAIANSRRRSNDPPWATRHTAPDRVDTNKPASESTDKGDLRHSRRPIDTHHDKSSRAKATSRPHDHDIVKRQYVVVDTQGREFYYNTHEEAIAKADRLDHQQQVDDAEAYQVAKRGNLQMTLTAENVNRAQTSQQPRRAMSHISGFREKSLTSTRLPSSEPTTRIERGDDVFIIPGDRTVEIATKDGDNLVVIGPGSSVREKRYHGSSRGTRSDRLGRSSSATKSRREGLSEEYDGYESAL